MDRVLSFGAGVNSTAILALMKLREVDESAVIFADTGAENPETYCHIRKLQKEIPIIVVKKEPPLYEYCMEKRIIPSRMFRWCSDKWKIQPINKELKNSNCKIIIGFAKGEEHRVKNRSQTEYPLLDLGLDRKACIAVIKKVGWKIPPKSGCFFCPYQKRLEWEAMHENSPQLFQKAVKLEKNCMRNDLFLYGDRPLSQFEQSQTRFSPLESYQSCLCTT